MWIIITEKKRNVIDNFSVNIPKDSIIAITGKSGAGKTTLIEIMSGWYSQENFQEKLNIDLGVKIQEMKNYFYIKIFLKKI